MSGFIGASKANFIAFCNTSKIADLVSKKQEIVNSVSAFYNLTPTSVLFVGFSSFMFAKFNAELFVTCVGQEVLDYLTESGIKYTYIPEVQLANCGKKFQLVIAVDEFFTYADSDQAQRNLVNQICDVTSGYVITTLRDYKNQDYKDREFSLPALIKNNNQGITFLEAHEHNSIDRNAWNSVIYQINNTSPALTVYGKFQRRAMYFKQLAKFSADAGATHFLVHKNLMYKGLIKKNYEHVITIRID